MKWNSIGRPLALGIAAVSVCRAGLSQPVITAQPTNQTVLAGGNAFFSVTANDSGPLAYQWQVNGSNISNPRISRIAGGNLGGDGSFATNASLSNPYGAALDAIGNLYILDPGHKRIRIVGTNGIIRTYAGTGTSGYSGDGGLATNAMLAFPDAVAIDSSGNIYFTDPANARIRKVDTNGIISTIAGNGTAGYSGDGGMATNASVVGSGGLVVDGAGAIYISHSSTNRVRRVDTNGIITTVAGTGTAAYSGDGGIATNANLSSPAGLALDAYGNLYIVDRGNQRVRCVGTNGIISTVAGNGFSGFSGDGGSATNARMSNPWGIVVNPGGNLFISDVSNNRIRRVGTNGTISTVTGGGSGSGTGDGGAATNATLLTPLGLALDRPGNLYLADSGVNSIRKVGFGGEPVLVLTNVTSAHAGDYQVIVTGPSGTANSAVATLTVNSPPAIASPPVSQIRTAGGQVSFTVNATGTAPLSYFWFLNGSNLVQASPSPALSLGPLSVSDAGIYTVVVTNSFGSITSAPAFLDVGLAPAITSQPQSQTVWAGNLLVLSVVATGTGPLSYQWMFNGANLTQDQIQTVGGNGSAGYSGDGGLATNARLSNPRHVARDSAGNIYFSDGSNNCVRKIDTYGMISTVAGNGTAGYSGDGAAATNAALNSPSGVAVDNAGNLYIAEWFNNSVRLVDTNGIISTVAGKGIFNFSGDGGPATNATFQHPDGIALDPFGNLYIADAFANRVRKVDTRNIITTFAGNGSGNYSGDGVPATNSAIWQPAGLAADAFGNLYVADLVNNRVRKVNRSGFISTIAGNGSAAYSGDGGAATNASLHDAYGLALDLYGNLYFSDMLNRRVRRVDTNGVISTVVGNGITGYNGDGEAATNASLGGSFGLNIDRAGNLAIVDNGNNRIRLVAYGGGPSLSFANVTATNAGTYSVVVRNAYGAVTSMVATVTVLLPPTISKISVQADRSIRLNFSGTPNSTNRIWTASSLSPPVNWVPVSTNIAGPDGTWQFIDTAATGSPVRFYRASMP